MAGKGNGHLDCTHASNPYHVCSEHCSEKKGDSKRQITRKDSGDGALKYSGERKKTVRSDCTNGSNPYHNCNEFCSNRTTQSARPKAERDSGSGGAKKDSRPKPPRELNVPLASAVTAKPQVTKPHVSRSPEEKLDLRNGDYIKPYAQETCFVEDTLTMEEQKRFSKLILVSANALKSENLQKPRKPDASPITSMKSKEHVNTRPDDISEIVQDPAVHDEEERDHKTASPNITSFPFPGIIVCNHEEGDHKTASPKITSFPFPGIARNHEEVDHKTASPNVTCFPFPGIARNHEESDEEEVKSASSEPSVPVGKYFVKESLAPILQSIFNKHGDIAASCKLESISIRSYYLECVCYIIQELQNTKLSQVSKSKVRELLAILNDVVSSKMNVGWLHSILNDVAEAVESSGQQWTLEVAKANCDHELQLTKKELESRMEDLKRKEKETSDAKAKVADTRARLSELEFKYFQLNEEISSLQLKVNNLKCNALTDELL